MNDHRMKKRAPAVDVGILCGGLGTRLRPALQDRPKALAPLANGTFIDMLMECLQTAGFRRFIFCIGHGGDQLQAHLRPPEGITYVFSWEDQPLGTAGALSLAVEQLRSDPVVIVNGDSYCAVDYEGLLAGHIAQGADLTLLLSPRSDCADYGTVHFSADGALQGFEEKSGRAESGWVNAGVYVMSARFLHALPKGGGSLERDVFPAWIGRPGSRVHPHGGMLFDIGTPGRWEVFQRWMRGGEDYAGKDRLSGGISQ